MRWLSPIVLLAISSVVVAQRADDQVANILRLHAIEREGHLKGDAHMVTSFLADSFVSVQNGKVEVQSREQVRRNFAEYLAGVVYSSWDDLMKPSVHISADGTMAWAVIQIKARFREKNDSTQTIQEFTSSWIAAYEKRASAWQMVGISSGCNPPCGSPPDAKQ